MLAAHNFTDLEKWAAALTALVCFWLCSAGAYFFNDILDRNHDRSHSSKKNRSVAAGAVSIPAALGVSIVLPVVGLATAWLAGIFPGIMTYYASTLLYSIYLKRLVVIDIVVLACLYCLRVFVGGESTNDPVSVWMAAFGGFLFISLAASKRYAELDNLRDPLKTSEGAWAENSHHPAAPGRGYTLRDMALVLNIGVSAACITPLILVLYLLDEKSGILYARPDLLMAASVLIFTWLATLWRDATTGLLCGEDPIRYSLSNPRSLFLLVLFGLAVTLATYSSR